MPVTLQWTTTLLILNSEKMSTAFLQEIKLPDFTQPGFPTLRSQVVCVDDLPIREDKYLTYHEQGRKYEGRGRVLK